MTETTASPDHLYNIFSVRRSGHHAVIGYLAGCLDAAGRTHVHVNDVDNNLASTHAVRTNWTAEAVLAKGAGASALIANYEDYSFTGRDQSPVYNGLTGAGVAFTDIVVVRDAYNLAASRVAKMAESVDKGLGYQFDVFSLYHGLELWAEHARAALQQPDGGPVSILYNHLVDRENTGYAQKLAAELGLTYSAAGLDKVSEYGGGSSIDGQRLDGQPHRMNVLNRWLDLPPDQLEWFMNAVNYGEIDTLNRQLFGFGMEEVQQSLAGRPA